MMQGEDNRGRRTNIQLDATHPD